MYIVKYQEGRVRFHKKCFKGPQVRDQHSSKAEKEGEEEVEM